MKRNYVICTKGKRNLYNYHRLNLEIANSSRRPERVFIKGNCQKPKLKQKWGHITGVKEQKNVQRTKNTTLTRTIHYVKPFIYFV